MIVAQIAAAEGRHVISLDIGSAYLNAKMPQDDPSKLVFMAITPIIAPPTRHFSARIGAT
jgi:hypothetical protein